MEARISYSNQYFNNISNWLQNGQLSTNPNLLYENEEVDNGLCKDEYFVNSLDNFESFNHQNSDLVHPDFLDLESNFPNSQNVLLFEANWGEPGFSNRVSLINPNIMEDNFSHSKSTQNECIVYEHQRSSTSSSDTSSLQQYTNLLNPYAKNTHSMDSPSGTSSESEFSTFLYPNSPSSAYFYWPEDSRANSAMSEENTQQKEQAKLDIQEENNNAQIDEQIRRNKEICWVLSPIRKYKEQMHFLQKKTNQQKIRRKFSLMSGPKQNNNKNKKMRKAPKIAKATSISVKRWQSEIWTKLHIQKSATFKQGSNGCWTTPIPPKIN